MTILPNTLRSHAVDIASDLHLIESDTLFLTKTQLTHGDCLAKIHNMLRDFSIIFNNNISRFSSLATAFRDPENLIEYLY